MQIVNNIEHICLKCGKNVGVAINPKYDKNRNVFTIGVVPCECSTENKSDKSCSNCIHKGYCKSTEDAKNHPDNKNECIDDRYCFWIDINE